MSLLDKPGERLKSFANVWEHFNAPPDIQKIIQSGHRIHFDSKPALTLPLRQYETKLSPEQMGIVHKEVDELVEKKALRNSVATLRKV